jgi:hypothetical protein
VGSIPDYCCGSKDLVQIPILLSSSVVDPDLDPVESKTYSGIRIRNEFKPNYSKKLIKFDNFLTKYSSKKYEVLLSKKYLLRTYISPYYAT